MSRLTCRVCRDRFFKQAWLSDYGKTWIDHWNVEDSAGVDAIPFLPSRWVKCSVQLGKLDRHSESTPQKVQMVDTIRRLSHTSRRIHQVQLWSLACILTRVCILFSVLVAKTDLFDKVVWPSSGQQRGASPLHVRQPPNPHLYSSSLSSPQEVSPLWSIRCYRWVYSAVTSKYVRITVCSQYHLTQVLCASLMSCKNIWKTCFDFMSQVLSVRV